MHVLITGNTGYVGPTLVQRLRAQHPNARLTGYDTGYFTHCLTGVKTWPEALLNVQINGDLRDFSTDALDKVDAVVHLAAISNDPMGNSFEAVTEDINFRASIEIARMAKASGASHFVFASSCSIYGFTDGGARKEGDELNPLTAYARSKVAMEKALAELADEHFTVTCLRFSTACGMSDRLRLDLVLNDFVAGAVSSGTIDILSDGTPWRPLIHVEDMARAIDWAVTRPADKGGDFLAANCGAEQWNYQIRDLAQAVAEVIPNTEVSINADAMPDKRSYRVDFALYRELAPAHQPEMTLEAAIAGLRDGLKRMDKLPEDFRESELIRLKVLDEHRRSGRLDDTLAWTETRASSGASA